MRRTASIPWTHEDLTGDEFLALCERGARGEIVIEQFGRGSSNGTWHALVRELPPRPAFPSSQVAPGDELPW